MGLVYSINHYFFIAYSFSESVLDAFNKHVFRTSFERYLGLKMVEKYFKGEFKF